ncbi:MAG: hypothetical protein V2I57_00640 [Xanthomonadales bacterium]|jgi:hypothetical protein|nr:hypothetical protein [Xanthomonadales bacterium]
MDSLRDLDALSGRLAGLRWLELSDNPALVDLGALRTLEPRALVGLWVLHNSSLKNLDALSGKLYPAGDAIVIEGNAALEQIDGLRGVGASSAYDRVAIVDNPSLTNLEGLSELRQIQGFSQIGLKFSGDLEVTGNTSLVDCSALGKVLGAPARPHDEDTDNVFRFVTIDETNGIGAQSPDDCLEAYTQRPPITLPDIRRATHGSWYDPLTTGEGLMLFTAPNGRLSLYFFGYTDDGEQQWLVAFSDDAPRWGEPVEFDVFSTSGGSFNDFDPSKVETVPWGSITLRLISCEVGELLMQGPSGTKWMTLTRLADTVGSPCNANGDRPPSATGSLTGAWYEPATDGQGFAVHHVSGDRGMVYFFGYRDDGADLWLVGVWDQPLRFGETLEMDVQVFTGGAYVYFEPGDIVSEVWGTLTLRFDDCDRGEAILEGQEGRQALDLQLLAGALGLACG